MTSIWIDRFGSFASATCALHCLVMSSAPALIPLLGLQVLTGELFEWGFFSTAMLLAVVAGAAAFRRHGTHWILVGFVFGALCLVTGRAAEALHLFEGGAAFAIAGGLALAGSHLTRIQLSRQQAADCCPPEGQPVDQEQPG